ncbi:hypothetical protein PYCC9005_002091 [Savitreella phatthalungensis]
MARSKTQRREQTQTMPATESIAPAAERRKPSMLPAILFAGSIVIRMVVMPLVAFLAVGGITTRSSYPQAYTGKDVSCTVEALDGPLFCEHELVFAEQGVALLSCDPGRGEWNTVMGPLDKPDPRGKLWLYDYAGSKKSTELDLQASGFPSDRDFHPLGLAKYASDDKLSLFVVNHNRFGPTIEVFEGSWTKKKASHAMQLTWKKTFGPDEEIISANAIAAVDHDHLYVTNDHASTRLHSGSVASVFETFTGVLNPRSFVSHIDLRTGNITRAAERVPFANGIAYGRYSTNIYVVSSTRGSVLVYDTTNPIKLRRIDEIKFGYILDNIDVVERTVTQHNLETLEKEYFETEELYVGGHPKYFGSAGLLAVKAAPHTGLSDVDPQAAPGDKRQAPSWISSARQFTTYERSRVKSDKPLNERPVHELYPLSKNATWHEPILKDNVRGKAKGREWRKRTIYQNDGREFRTAAGMAIDVHRNIGVSGGLYEQGVLVCRGVMERLRPAPPVAADEPRRFDDEGNEVPFEVWSHEEL